VDRIRNGDRAAEAELVERYHRAVDRILRKSGGARDDLYQDVFRSVLEKIRAGELREPERVSGFVCSLARNVAVANLRRSERYQPLEAEPEVPGNQLDRLLAKEREQAARRILSELESPRDREVLYRYYLAEEPREALCSRFGITSVHLNQVLHRARERFRDLYTKAAAKNVAARGTSGA
jgi:RNA polymerase sigma-70 factor (ECF subfamily)